jgi:hypothetical protein
MVPQVRPVIVAPFRFNSNGTPVGTRTSGDGTLAVVEGGCCISGKAEFLSALCD